MIYKVQIIIFANLFLLLAMKKLFIYICIFCSAISALNGQSRRGLYGHSKSNGYSILMIGGGPAYLFGDVGGAMSSTIFKGSTFNPSSTRAFGTLGYRYIFPNNLSVRANLLVGSFYGEDSNTNLALRAYTFNSTIIEASLQTELFLLGGPDNYRYNPHSLYIFAGAGNVTFMPQVSGNSRYGDVIKSVPDNAPIVPFGLGYEVYLGNSFSFGTEVAFRYAFDDFLDGLKTPFSDNNDLLVNLNFTLSYNLSLGMSHR